MRKGREGKREEAHTQQVQGGSQWPRVAVEIPVLDSREKKGRLVADATDTHAGHQVSTVE